MLKNLNAGSDKIVDIDKIIFEEQKDFLNVAVLHELWERFEFSKLFPTSDLKEVSTAQIAEILTLSKLLKPSSNIKTVDWFSGTYLPEILKINSLKYNRMKIFNELGLIEKQKTSLEQRMFHLAKKFNQDEFEIYFLDGTTTFFEGTQRDLGSSGMDKTTGFKTHMVLIMLVTNRQGYPCAWAVCNGRASETVEFKKIAKRICSEYNIKNITFCFDRGFASTSNFELIDENISKFISGIDKDQIAKVFDAHAFQNVKTHLIERSQSEQVLTNEKKRILPVDGFYTADGNRFYKELGIKEKYRYIAGFSVKIHNAEFEKRSHSQQEALLEINDYNNELSQAKKDRDLDVVNEKIISILEKFKMKSIISFVIKPIAVGKNKKMVQSCRIECQVIKSEWDKACLLDGVFIYITDQVSKKNDSFELSAFDILNHYKNKFIIEQDFRDLKNIINIRPLFVRLEEHVKAIVTICMLSQFINVHITQLIKELGLSIEKFYELLNKSSSVATMATSARSFKKQIKPKAELKDALDILEISEQKLSTYIKAI
jgi:transposase